MFAPLFKSYALKAQQHLPQDLGFAAVEKHQPYGPVSITTNTLRL